jgi:hypothetical protein
VIPKSAINDAISEKIKNEVLENKTSTCEKNQKGIKPRACMVCPGCWISEKAEPALGKPGQNNG